MQPDEYRQYSSAARQVGPRNDPIAKGLRLTGEIGVGLTPAGVSIDVRDFNQALANGDGVGMVLAGVGFLPGGDIVKGAGKALRSTNNVPVPRTGPRGVDPNHHNANVTVRDTNGSIVSHDRVVSGNMTPDEAALGFPNGSLASHTEVRALNSTQLEAGQSMTITGQNSPCPRCKGAMNEAAAESDATIRYQWREAGKTNIWEANR